ncbi:hypothetical protein [Noviherbaspirillum sp. ST9]|uniref:hypothetical protein n=1 Tax=Noviherbaspirillum sp. ST9 TaxID=3401606 RepID=UPI003B585FF3
MDRLKNDKLTLAWLGLLFLSAAGLAAGLRAGHASWLPIIVAALIWLKGWLVTRYFLNAAEAHPYVTWLLRIFTAFAPAALVLTTTLG